MDANKICAGAVVAVGHTAAHRHDRPAAVPPMWRPKAKGGRKGDRRGRGGEGGGRAAVLHLDFFF